MQGSESLHLKLRRATVDFMLEHQDDFQPYMEDDENFGAYCKRMSKVSRLSMLINSTLPGCCKRQT